MMSGFDQNRRWWTPKIDGWTDLPSRIPTAWARNANSQQNKLDTMLTLTTKVAPIPPCNHSERVFNTIIGLRHNENDRGM